MHDAAPDCCVCEIKRIRNCAEKHQPSVEEVWHFCTSAQLDGGGREQANHRRLDVAGKCYGRRRQNCNRTADIDIFESSEISEQRHAYHEKEQPWGQISKYNPEHEDSRR